MNSILRVITGYSCHMCDRTDSYYQTQLQEAKTTSMPERHGQIDCPERVTQSSQHKMQSKYSNFIYSYLRAQDSYNPPKNVARKIQKLLSNVLLSSTNKLNREDKFTFLKLCESEFGRAVPSSLLHEVNSISKLLQFKHRRIKFLYCHFYVNFQMM